MCTNVVHYFRLLYMYMHVRNYCVILQIDLIDMRHCPDNTYMYQWIGQYMDHWSKFHILFPLSQKSASEVGYNLQRQVFAFLGTPRILHYDNGREFVNEIVHNLVKQWPGNVTIIDGRPRATRDVRDWLNRRGEALGCSFK